VKTRLAAACVALATIAASCGESPDHASVGWRDGVTMPRPRAVRAVRLDRDWLVVQQVVYGRDDVGDELVLVTPTSEQVVGELWRVVDVTPTSDGAMVIGTERVDSPVRGWSVSRGDRKLEQMSVEFPSGTFTGVSAPDGTWIAAGVLDSPDFVGPAHVEIYTRDTGRWEISALRSQNADLSLLVWDGDLLVGTSEDTSCAARSLDLERGTVTCAVTRAEIEAVTTDRPWTNAETLAVCADEMIFAVSTPSESEDFELVRIGPSTRTAVPTPIPGQNPRFACQFGGASVRAPASEASIQLFGDD
jgi:hypothetical protein